MAAKTSYTESELATFMVAILDSAASNLGLTASSSSVLAAVTAVERLLGVTDVATLTDMPVLESAAAWKAWQAAYGAAVTQASEIRAGSAGLKWDDRLDGIREALTLAEGAYYAAAADSAAASGGSSFTAFAVIQACRGR